MDAEKIKTLDEMLKIPLADLSHGDRTRLLTDLLLAHETRSAVLAEPAQETAMLIFAADDIEPGKVASIPVRNYETFKLTRLVILETEREVMDAREVVTTHRDWLWRKRIERTTTETRRTVRTSAAAWALRQAFSGSQNLMPGNANCKPLGAGGFSVEVALPLAEFTAHAGVDVMISVSHQLESPAPFRGVMFGRRLDTMRSKKLA